MSTENIRSFSQFNNFETLFNNFIDKMTKMENLFYDKMKIIDRNSNIIDNHYKMLFKDLKIFFLKFQNSKKLEKYFLNELILISKRNWEENIQSISLIKKNNLKLISENNFLKKENSKLEIKKNFLDSEIFDLKEKIKKKEYEVNFEILENLKIENKNLKNFIKNNDQDIQEYENTIKRVILEKNEIHKEMKLLDKKNICALRQERIRITQLKKEKDLFIKKSENFEKIIDNNNIEIENLNSKIIELKSSVSSILENQDFEKKKKKIKNKFQNPQKIIDNGRFINNKLDNLKFKKKEENLKLYRDKINSLEIQIAIERDVFGEIKNEFQKKKNLLEKNIKTKIEKIEFLLKNKKIQKAEVFKLQSQISIKSENMIKSLKSNDFDNNSSINEKNSFTYSENKIQKKRKNTEIKISIHKNLDRFLKIKNRLKTIYKLFVILISEQKNKSSFIEIERKINNLLSMINLYIS